MYCKSRLDNWKCRPVNSRSLVVQSQCLIYKLKWLLFYGVSLIFPNLTLFCCLILIGISALRWMINLSVVNDRMVDTMASCIATFHDLIIDWKCMSYRHTALDMVWRTGAKSSWNTSQLDWILQIVTNTDNLLLFITFAYSICSTQRKFNTIDITFSLYVL